MGLKEEIIDAKKEMNDIRQHSIAWEMLKDTKQSIKRICIAFTIVLCVILILFGATIAYLIHTLNDIGTEEITTTETYEVEQEANNSGNNNFIHGNNNEVK